MKPLLRRSNSIIADFSSLMPADEARVGGKAYTLGVLLQAGFHVPPGCVLDHPPTTDEDNQEIEAWFRLENRGDLAVRSSAIGEDSSDFSFAGQQKSFLHVATMPDIFKAIQDCYASIQSTASCAYRGHFGIQSNQLPKMNVILQRMVDARFAGVYFSVDPRDGKPAWIVEVIEGLGERLVSGQVTPFRFREDQDSVRPAWPAWKQNTLDAVVKAGAAARALLGYEVDMEWAVDSAGDLWILQARPITSLPTVRQNARLNVRLETELRRLGATHPPSTVWDGKPFAEWTGTSTSLTLSLWQLAFSSRGALGTALKKAGYLGQEEGGKSVGRTLLETVFGRPYVNLSRLEKLYFGPSAYVTVPEPHPHLEFQWDHVDFKTLLAAPLAALRMIRASWVLQTERGELLQECRKQLAHFTACLDLDLNSPSEKSRSLSALAEDLDKLTREFSETSLVWPLLLVILAEATEQVIRDVLSRKLGLKASEETLQRWMAGLHTLTVEMDRQYEKACDDPSLQPEFLKNFGQRGPGELELANPRWRELAGAAFHAGGFGKLLGQRKAENQGAEFAGFGLASSELLHQELERLTEMLELREIWKSQSMRQYAQIRLIVLEVARKLRMQDDQIFHLRLRELLKLARDPSEKHRRIALLLISRRRKRSGVFKGVSLPSVVTLSLLRPHFQDSETSKPLHGEPISPGLAYGQVITVQDPSHMDLSTLPEDMILVAEATDPGWTPLFLRAKAVVVERGGILSHCAIVARELGIPAVSGVEGCVARLKSGTRVWVDGTNGNVNPV